MTNDAALDRVRDLALALPEAMEHADDGASEFLIEDEYLFAHVHRTDGGSVLHVKTSGAEEQTRLIEAQPEVYARPEQSHAPDWIVMYLPAKHGDWDQVADRIAISWEMVAPRRLLEAGGR